MNNRHFFFKFNKANIGLIQLLKLPFDEKKIPLPIYFGVWKKDDYYNNYHNLEFQKNFHRKKQVDIFFELRNVQDDIYFWVFLSDKVYLIKLNRPYEIFDWQEDLPEYLVNAGSNPKYYFGSIVKSLEKDNLPESFSNINTNQKYNRQTIVEFTGNEGSIADSLVSLNRFTISYENRLVYLSPIQFETLIFLIFVQNNIYCSTCRGGTKEKYDLKIDNNKTIFPEFEDGIVNIQIKMKKEFSPPKSDSKTIYIYLGNTDKDKRLFGSDWIHSKIKDHKYINDWLEKSLNYFLIEM